MQSCLCVRSTQHSEAYLHISKYQRFITTLKVSCAYRLAALQGKHRTNNRWVTWQAPKQKKKNAAVLLKIYKRFTPTESSRKQLICICSVSGHNNIKKDFMFWCSSISKAQSKPMSCQTTVPLLINSISASGLHCQR